MRVTTTITTLYVRDLERSLPWWERLFGRPVDEQPMPGCHEWDTGPDVIVQVMQDAARAGGRDVAFVVASLDDAVRALGERGLDAGAVREAPGFARWCTLADPDGNEVSVVESLRD